MPCDYSQVGSFLTTGDIKHSALILYHSAGNQPFHPLVRANDELHLHQPVLFEQPKSTITPTSF